MTKYEELMVARLLRLASDQFANHGCNELDDDFFEGIPKDEINRIDHEMFIENGEEEYFEKDLNIMVGDDSALMDHFADMLEWEVE